MDLSSSPFTKGAWCLISGPDLSAKSYFPPSGVTTEKAGSFCARLTQSLEPDVWLGSEEMFPE